MDIVYGLLLSGLMHFSDSTLATSLKRESSSSCRSLSETCSSTQHCCLDLVIELLLTALLPGNA